MTYDIKDNLSQDLRIKRGFDSRLYNYMQEADMIYFLAFDVGGCKYLSKNQYEFDYINNNMLIMQNTFEMLKNKKFIFASTQLINTPGAYGTLKLIGEFYTKSLGGLSVRLWNIYGFEHPGIRSHVICDFIYQALTTKKISMMSDGSEERQFLYAEDCAKYFYNIAKNYKLIDREASLHLSSHKWIKIIDLANLIASIIPGTEIITGTYSGHVIKTEPDSYLQNYFCDKYTSLENGIKTLVSQYELWIKYKEINYEQN